MNEDEEKFSVVKSILGLTTFSTILPINTYTSIEYMTRMVWCWPFIHLFIGVLAYICGYICLNIFHLNLFFTSVIIFGFLMIIEGYNHVDGVMDMSDGVMVHGEPSRKISVMKDSSVGAGGIMSVVILSFVTIAGLFNILEYKFLIGIIIAEFVSKTALLTTCLVSTPTEGIGGYFIRSTNQINYVISTVIVFIIAYLIGDVVGIIGVIGAILAGLIIAYIAHKNFKVANGDVLGTSNEFGRAIALLFMAIALFYL